MIVDMIVRSYELKRRKKRFAHFRDYIIDRWNIDRFSRRIDRGKSSKIRVIWAQNFSLLSNETRVDGYIGSVEIRISFFNVRLSVTGCSKRRVTLVITFVILIFSEGRGISSFCGACLTSIESSNIR